MKDVFFWELARRSGNHWEEIGLYLNVDFDFQEQLRSDFPPGVPGNAVKCSMRMFVKWRQSGGKTLRDLHDALMEAQEGGMAAFVMHNARQYHRARSRTKRQPRNVDLD